MYLVIMLERIKTDKSQATNYGQYVLQFISNLVHQNPDRMLL